MSMSRVFLLFLFHPTSGDAGDGRFNKAYCLRGGVWGNSNFWASLGRSQTFRVAQLSTGSSWLSVSPQGAFSLSPTPLNVTMDFGCNNRSAPDYFAISFGSYGAAPAWAAGPIGDSTRAKTGRCWWVRCSLDEREFDTCGSEGEAPCVHTNATFLRYAAPSETPLVDRACYPITQDSQMDPFHRVNFTVSFVDGLWPPPRTER
jgi:hypothetical protein